jgi:chorismate dehydratase
MDAKISVSAVSYLNTVPFTYGLRQPSVSNYINLILNHPAECARRVEMRESKVGLVPVAALAFLPNHIIISDFCIGTNGEVRTVSLLSNSPLNEIKTIYLDSESKTSVQLVKVLAQKFWGKEFLWQPAIDARQKVGTNEGIVAIGDKVFKLEKEYDYNYDLAKEWKKMTGLPFVFAVWVSNGELPKYFIDSFNTALKFGVNNLDAALENYHLNGITKKEAKEYLTQNISYNFDAKKREAMDLFLTFGRSIAPG